MTARGTTEAPKPPVIDLILFAKGMAVIRIFFGIILLANGLAKLEPAFGRNDLGPYHANLITREGARGILNFEVNERRIREGAPQGTQVPGLKWFVNNVVLANWGFFQWLVVLVEVGAGLRHLIRHKGEADDRLGAGLGKRIEPGRFHLDGL